MEIGTLAASAVTTINRETTPSLVLIGAIDENVVLDGLVVTIGGEVTISIQGQTHIQAFAKYMTEGLLGADVKVGMILKLASGELPNERVQLRMSNAGATTPTVYGYSISGRNAQAYRVAQQTIQAIDSVRYGAGFQALIIEQTNLDYAQMEFIDGHTDKFSVVELASLFALDNQCDADGLLAGRLMIDNQRKLIKSVTLYTTSGGTMTVTVVKPFAQARPQGQVKGGRQQRAARPVRTR